MTSRSHLWLVLSFGLVTSGFAQTWRSTLYPENWQRPNESSSFYNDKLIQDFSYAGYENGEQVIPNVAGPVFDAVATYGADSTGNTDSTTAIQAAIDAAEATGGGVVNLPAGTYKISPQGSNSYCLRISKSDVVLRGAGVSDTFLLNTATEMNSKSVILVQPSSTSTGTEVNFTADLNGPTRRLPVAAPNLFSVGDMIRLQWKFTDEWIAEHGQRSYWSEAGGAPSDASYLREVTAVNEGEGWIEIDIPTRYTMKVRDSARAMTRGGMLSDVGIESLAIGNVQHPGTSWADSEYNDPTKPAYDVHASYLIQMCDSMDSWITSVESFQAATNTSTCHMLSNGIVLNDCVRVTVKDSKMSRAQYGGGGGNGYMIRLKSSNDCLIQNFVANFSRHGIVTSHAGTSGNVFLQCEDRETRRATGDTGSYIPGGGGSDNHMHFSHSNLWDGCHVHNSFYTASHRGHSGTIPHGLTSAHAIYWNTSGSGSGTKNSVIVYSDQGRYGYVIGTSGSKFAVDSSVSNGTAPEDHVEGTGMGDQLQPSSLYLDQLARRTAPTVTYQGNGSTGGTVPLDASSPYSTGATVTIQGPGGMVRSNFTFNGWNTESDGSGMSYAVSSTFIIDNHLTLYAQWLGTHVTVNFDANGGTMPNPTSKVVSRGMAYGTLATTSRSGYVFGGWFTAPSGSTEVTSSTLVDTASTHTLYAQWSVTPLTATLTSIDQIVGVGQVNAPALGYYSNTGENLVGCNGSSATSTRKCVNLVFGYALPTLPVGTTIDGATFRFEITANRDQSNVDPALNVHLLNVVNPDSTGASHYFHGATDGSVATTLVGSSYIAVGNTDVAYPDDQEDRAFVLSGAALSLLEGYYGGDHVPERGEVFFRFSLSTNIGINNLDRYYIDLAADESALEITPTAQSEFYAWVEAKGTGSETFSGDANSDGLADGLAWLLGTASPSQAASGRLPLASYSAGNLSLDFSMLKAAARGSGLLKLQYSRDLGVTDLWDNNTVRVPDSSGTVDGVVFTIIQVDGQDVQQVEATIPASVTGGSDRVFIRLSGELP